MVVAGGRCVPGLPGLVFVTGACIVEGVRLTGACWGALVRGAGAGRCGGAEAFFLSCCAAASATIPARSSNNKEPLTNFLQHLDGIMASSWLKLMAGQGCVAYGTRTVCAPNSVANLGRRSPITTRGKRRTTELDIPAFSGSFKMGNPGIHNSFRSKGAMANKILVPCGRASQEQTPLDSESSASFVADAGYNPAVRAFFLGIPPSRKEPLSGNEIRRKIRTAGITYHRRGRDLRGERQAQGRARAGAYRGMHSPGARPDHRRMGVGVLPQISAGATRPDSRDR